MRDFRSESKLILMNSEILWSIKGSSKKITDELAKNHHDDNRNVISFFMFEELGKDAFPTRSYSALYYLKLNPDYPGLWHTHIDRADEEEPIW